VNLAKTIKLSNKHYQGLSEQWIAEVIYIKGGPRSRFEGTMEECGEFIKRTLVKTGQPYGETGE
jgi:hypothetical protein